MVFPLAEKSISRLTTVMRNFLLPSKNSSSAYLQVISQHISKTLIFDEEKETQKSWVFHFHAAQRDHQTIGIQDGSQEKQAFKGLLDGTGEYTLVYEDNEGDRMLAGDIPWE